MVKEIVKIDLEKILFYYDGVQIFLGFDIENNEKYLGLLMLSASEEYENDNFYTIRLTKDEYIDILIKQIDLRHFIINRTHKEWYNGEFFQQFKKVILVANLQQGEIPEVILPTEGFFVNDYDIVR